MAFLEIDAAKMRGKERSERIFALIGDEAVAASARFRELHKAHAKLQQAMRAGDASGRRGGVEGVQRARLGRGRAAL